MRTMPSDTEVTVPSLRASAASLTVSMRLLISSLISEGLSWVLAISGSSVRASGWCAVSGSCGGVAPAIAGPQRPCLLVQCRLQAAELAAQRTIDDDVPGADHRTADEGGVDRGFNFNRGAETTLQRGADTGHLGFRELGRRGHRRAHDAFGFGAQVFVQARDFRQLGQATI